MIVTATVSFAGAISMVEGEKRDIPIGEILSDLLECGYVVSESKVDADEIKRNKVSKRKAISKD